MILRHTIARMTGTKNNEWLDFGTVGDKFWVRYSTQSGTEAEKRFETAAAAVQVYTKLAGWILIGAYNEESRIQYLTTGTME